MDVHNKNGLQIHEVDCTLLCMNVKWNFYKLQQISINLPNINKLTTKRQKMQTINFENH